MSLSINKILPFLICPITGKKLRQMTKQDLGWINALMIKKKAGYLSKQKTIRAIKSGLITFDSKIIYECYNGIALLLPQLAITKFIHKKIIFNKFHFNKIKVKIFYDQIGWNKTKDNNFVDADKFEDLRPVSKEYIHRCHLRLARYIKPSGMFLIDVASGPVQYKEYLFYSRKYQYHVCVDFSISALLQAKNRLGKRGIYILGDITSLPFADSSMDGIISLHTIYHVPAGEQKKAFNELFRVLKVSSTASVVYSWGNRGLMRYLMLPIEIVSILKYLTKKFLNKNNRRVSQEPILYFHPHSYRWFVGQKWNFNYDILPWRSINVAFMNFFIHNWFFGKSILKFIYFFEEKFPYFIGKIGQYPIIVIKK